ncbi:hypothetical protein RvY_07649 [Ramazzottius varieornatus]|uniref:Homeobox domain-containing protein n=1 Tax=Ramazzottius varieornatus TaxID=947166 RepID=A0A1D1VBA9_RAMVA|nr:hypothetical protein RvY_07649 [Ramazzottius varieornatus]
MQYFMIHHRPMCKFYQRSHHQNSDILPNVLLVHFGLIVTEVLLVIVDLIEMPYPSLRARLVDSRDLPQIRTDQEEALLALLRKNLNPGVSDIQITAAELGLPPLQVRIWLQHLLAYWRISQGFPPNNRRIYEVPQPPY